MARNSLSGDNVPSGYGTYQLQNYTPGQMQLHERGLQNVGPDSYFSRMAAGDQSFFNDMEAPAKRQFNEQLGGLSSRFSGMGMGSRHSSGFQNAATSAASNFSQELAAKRNDYRRQAILDLHGMSQDLLGNSPYTRGVYKKEQQGNPWATAATGAISGAATGFMSGGPWGAVGGGIVGGANGYFGGSGGDSASFGKEFGNIINNYRNNDSGGGGAGGGGGSNYNYSSSSSGGKTMNTSGPYNLPTFGGF